MQDRETKEIQNDGIRKTSTPEVRKSGILSANLFYCDRDFSFVI
jgi:hypothetical protein